MKKDALALLARPGILPPAHQAAIADGDTAGARCALKCAELRTLRQALAGLTDTRSPKSRRHPFSAMLSLLVYGLLCGAQDVKAIWERGSGELKTQTRYFVTSLEREERSAPQLGEAIRGHWSVENIALCRGAVARHAHVRLKACLNRKRHSSTSRSRRTSARAT